MQNFRGKDNIDDISLKILGLLQENARMSYTEIGQKIGMASTSVKERVQKLEDVGIIKKYKKNILNGRIILVVGIQIWFDRIIELGTTVI